MARLIPLLLAIAVAAGDEAVRRDAVLAVALPDGSYDFTLANENGSGSGSDSFDQPWALRLGGRWAWSRPGATWAPVAGADLLARSQGFASGGDLSGYGLSAAAGAVYAPHDRWQLTGEAHLDWLTTDATIDATQLAPGFSASGDATGWGVRIGAQYALSDAWWLGGEVGYGSTSYSLSGDGRELDIDQAGPAFGLTLVWRPVTRPTRFE